MSLTLIVRQSSDVNDPPSAGLGSITFDSPRVVVGRGDGCDLRLPDLSVSHRHASFRQRGSDYLVVDEGSSNGTFLGSMRLHPQSPRVVKSGDRVRVGRVWVEVRIDQSVATPHANQATRDLALALVAQALEAQGDYAGPRLIVVAGPDKDKVLPLDDSGRALIIGRGRESDFLLDITDASRRHTQVLRKADICYVRDLGSKIGTYTADGPVPMEKDCQLRHGDSFAIGPDLFVFEHAASEALKELERADDAAFEAPPEPVSQPAPECAPEAKEQEPQPAPTPTLSAPQPQRPRAKKPEPQGGWTAADVGIFILAIAILGFSALGLFWLFRSN